MTQIVFTNNSDYSELDPPKPASEFIPDWYKNTASYMSEAKEPMGDGNGSGTIKRCIPVFDAITAGYIITSPADVFVTQRDGEPWYEWSSFNLIQFHPIAQAPEHPNRNGLPYPKWINPWGIKTLPGYSCLFVQPFHREAIFTILPGVVDTDMYTPPINFPFVLNDKSFVGLIPAGTPIAQVIPFKRENWKHEIGSKEDLKKQMMVVAKLKTKIFDRYKNMFWDRKSYK
jgi:hypothetical protein